MRKENRNKLHKQILETVLQLPNNKLFYQESGSHYINNQGELGEKCSLKDLAKILRKAFGYDVPITDIKVALQSLKIDNNYYGKLLKSLDKNK